MKSNHYDAIIIGSGHNGLVAAAYLAKQGKRFWIWSGIPSSAAWLWPSPSAKTEMTSTSTSSAWSLVNRIVAE